ncbi:MAG: sigma-70 family RNA polymerase sigma factor [Flavobacteriales bacterium]
MDESRLIAGCRRNDLRCQKELYDLMHPKMLGVCMRYAADRDQAQELLQEGFIKVFRKIDSFKGDGSFEGWVRKIMVNTSLEHFRREKAKAIEVGLEKESLMVVSNEPTALSEMAAADIMRAVSQLPQGYKMVFNLFAIEGYSHEEIAIELDISVNTSYSQYHRAKAMLQKMITGEKKATVKKAM